MFVLFPFVFWPLYCLYLRLLSTPLVSSNFSYVYYWINVSNCLCQFAACDTQTIIETSAKELITVNDLHLVVLLDCTERWVKNVSNFQSIWLNPQEKRVLFLCHMVSSEEYYSKIHITISPNKLIILNSLLNSSLWIIKGCFLNFYLLQENRKCVRSYKDLFKQIKPEIYYHLFILDNYFCRCDCTIISLWPFWSSGLHIYVIRTL